MPDLPIITGAELGPQTHIRAACPRPRSLNRPAMVSGHYGNRLREHNQPSGGLWTSTLREDGSTAYSSYTLEHDTRFIQGLKWWRLDPNPDARILSIDSEADYEAAFEHYQYQDSSELDFVAMLEDGIDAVQLTDAGIADNEPHFDDWRCESVVWFRWVFSDPSPYEPPEEYQHLLAKPSRKDGKLATKTARYGLSGKYKGFWFTARPLKKRQKKLLARALRYRDNGASSANELGEMIIGEMITDHNFTKNGIPLPVGPELCWLIPQDLAEECIRAFFMGVEQR